MADPHLAHRLLPHLAATGGFLGLMYSHRGSIAISHKDGLKLHRASKAALNMLTRGIYGQNSARGLMAPSIHSGWVATRMETLDGTVAAEMEIGPNIASVAAVVERHRASGENLYRDWEEQPVAW